MAEFAENCPRCGTVRATFVIGGDWAIERTPSNRTYEIAANCRVCRRTTIFVGEANFAQSHGANAYDAKGSLTAQTGLLPAIIRIVRFVSVRDIQTRQPPANLPDPVRTCFEEGAACFSIECFNAAAAMFRLCLDLATKSLLPEEGAESGPNRAQRTRLFDRIEYLLERDILPPGLRELADCVREDGNDGAHDGSLAKADAEDLVDFTEALLERVFTEPERLRLARERRAARRQEL